MLTITDLSVNYGPVHALAHVSIEVPRGEVTAVIGANGAGKSTLMRTLAGLVKPLTGEATLDGVKITGHKAEDIVRMGVALVPEGRSTSRSSRSRRTSAWAGCGAAAPTGRPP